MEEAKASLLAAAKLDPKSREVRATLEQVNAALKEQRKKDAQMWGSAFRGGAGGGGTDGGGGGGAGAGRGCAGAGAGKNDDDLHILD